MKNGAERIVVMGGSFNPPTVAHYKLMQQAVELLQADAGLFVPVSDAYLRRKMRSSLHPVVLSPETRVRMLRSMCADDRIGVCEREIGTIRPQTMATLEAIQQENPGAEVYFLMGDDKLSLLTNLAAKAQLLDRFKVGLYTREDGAIRQTLQNHEVLKGFQHRIVLLPTPEGTEGVSSSIVRDMMMRGESSRDLLCDGVWELFRGLSERDFPATVYKFGGDYAFLDNRFTCQFVWRDVSYGSAEAAFRSYVHKVYSECSADKATVKGKDRPLYPEWEDKELAIMESILRAKFEQNPALMDKLRGTGNTVLINGKSRKETFWGIDLYSWQGENQLGKILMNIRDRSK